MPEEYGWDWLNATRMGDYLTKVESRFITQCLTQCAWVTTILDIGGGSGRFAHPLHECGYNVMVTEMTPAALQSLQDRNPVLPSVLTSPYARELPVADRSVDCVLCIEVFALADDAAWFFPECYRVLREDGILIFTTHNKNSYKGMTKKLILRDRAFYSQSIGSTRTRLRDAGFAVLREQSFNWAPVKRLSNSRLIPVTGFVEQQMQPVLDHLVALSPWVLVLAQKRISHEHTSIRRLM